MLCLEQQKEELNQYWYSAATVEALAREIAAETRAGARVAFLSTPSVYFAFQALAEAATRDCVLFDVRFCPAFDVASSRLT